MLQQNWFADSKFEMFEDYGDAQSFYDTETKNIYVVMEEYSQKVSNTIQEITPESEEYAPNYEKYKAYMESESKDFMAIVQEICAMTSANCRSLNKTDLARKLMDMINIPKEAEISEIPLDWENQVEICFILPNDDNYYSLYAGHWLDDTESMKLVITGKVKGDHSDFYEEEVDLPLNYFEEKHINVNSSELAKRIVDCITYGYDKSQIEEIGMKLWNELSQISNDSCIKIAFVALCNKIEKLEMSK